MDGNASTVACSCASPGFPFCLHEGSYLLALERHGRLEQLNILTDSHTPTVAHTHIRAITHFGLESAVAIILAQCLLAALNSRKTFRGRQGRKAWSSIVDNTIRAENKRCSCGLVINGSGTCW